jgi:hypothetical protein
MTELNNHLQKLKSIKRKYFASIDKKEIAYVANLSKVIQQLELLLKEQDTGSLF